MFDPEKHIADWRRQMLDAGVKAPVPLDELENHLRDEIARLMSENADAQTAFENAAQKIGEAHLLKNEFEKLQSLNRSRWYRQKPMVVVLLFSAFAILLIVGIVSGFGELSQMSFDDRLSGLGAVSVMIVLAAAGYFARQFIPQIATKRTRQIICISAGTTIALWWEYFLQVALPRRDCMMMGELQAAVIWGFAMPFGAFLGLLAIIEKPQLSIAGFSGGIFMKNEKPSLESGLSTYLRSLVFVTPAIIFWMLGMTYVIPQLRVIWLQSGAGTPDGPIFVNTVFAIMESAKDYFIYIVALIGVALALLEWRSKGWPRFRRATIGTGVFVINVAILFFFFIMIIAATIAGVHLAAHIK